MMINKTTTVVINHLMLETIEMTELVVAEVVVAATKVVSPVESKVTCQESAPIRTSKGNLLEVVEEAEVEMTITLVDFRRETSLTLITQEVMLAGQVQLSLQIKTLQSTNLLHGVTALLSLKQPQHLLGSAMIVIL